VQNHLAACAHLWTESGQDDFDLFERKMHKHPK